MNCVNIIRRYDGETTGDILILGGSGYIVVSLFEKNKFHTV